MGSLSLVILSGNPWHPTKEMTSKKAGFLMVCLLKPGGFLWGHKMDQPERYHPVARFESLLLMITILVH